MSLLDKITWKVESTKLGFYVQGTLKADEGKPYEWADFVVHGSPDAIADAKRRGRAAFAKALQVAA